MLPIGVMPRDGVTRIPSRADSLGSVDDLFTLLRPERFIHAAHAISFYEAARRGFISHTLRHSRRPLYQKIFAMMTTHFQEAAAITAAMRENGVRASFITAYWPAILSENVECHRGGRFRRRTY